MPCIINNARGYFPMHFLVHRKIKLYFPIPFKLKFISFTLFFFCTARQHPTQNASTHRHGQPALMDICKVLNLPNVDIFENQLIWWKRYWQKSTLVFYYKFQDLWFFVGWFSKIFLFLIITNILTPNYVNFIVLCINLISQIIRELEQYIF